MKNTFILLIWLLTYNSASAQVETINTVDITRYWQAYDKVIATKDSVTQLKYINDYLDNGSPGVKAMMQARRYTPEEYRQAMISYPEFWASIRPNTLKAGKYAIEIEKGLNKLRQLYPDGRPAKVYFVVGALRSGGTTLSDMVLIGSEIAMADKNVVTAEMPEYFSHLRGYFDTNPVNEIVFLNVHEYVHTQQKSTIGYCLLAQCIIEGVAEFVAVKALNNPSPNPQIKFGEQNDSRLKAAFQKEMFSPLFHNWLWNDNNNEFGMRDLGYYMGYAMCERYYNGHKDKKAAIKQMIELDYNNPDALMAFTDATGYFEKKTSDYLKEFNASRPRVVGIREFKNGSVEVDPTIKTLTIEFSEPMDTRFRNLGVGPLGENSLLNVVSLVGFSDDGRSITYGIELSPGKRQQLQVQPQFRDTDGLPLEPYLIDITTK